jgi:NADP-dependent 3-hydroxy acid dehydrogenase YdfG
MVITGASSGIGFATAIAAAEFGVKLVLTARSSGALKEIARDFDESGAEAIALPSDVAVREQV